LSIPLTAWIVLRPGASNLRCQASTVARYDFEWL
jgi:hypothetical protein